MDRQAPESNTVKRKTLPVQNRPIIVVFLIIVFMLLFACSSKEHRREVFNPEKNLKEAQELIDNYEFDRARRLLIEVKNRDTTGQYAPLAQLKIAESYIEEEDIDRAVEAYREFLKLYPDHPQAPYAQYQIGMLYFKQIKDPERGSGIAKKAMEEFEKLLRDFPRNPYRTEAELRIKQCRYYLSEYEFIVGRFYYKKGSCRAAIGRFEGLIKNFPDSKRVPEAMLLTAECYKKEGKPRKARHYLQRLLSLYPRSPFADDAKEALEELTRKD